MIPDEAVEAAAAAIFGKNLSAPWATSEYKAPWLRDARAALEAAAPHMNKARTITTRAELDALPSGSVVVTADGEANIFHDNGWVLPNGPGGYTSWAIAQGLPAVVVYEPEPTP